MRKLRVGIFGTGGMGKTHAHCLMRHPDVEVVAAWSRSQANLKKFTDAKWDPIVYAHESLGEFTPTGPIPKAYLRWLDLARDPEVDAVSITSPNALHAPQAIASLENGKHVLVEKPMCVSTAEAKKMLDAAERNKRLLCVAQCWRFHPEVEEARWIVRSGKIGRPVKVKSYGIHKLWGPGGWFSDPKLAGGGALLDMGVHGIDTARYILGEPETVTVYGKLHTGFSNRRVDDVGTVVVTLQGGAVLVVESGWDHPYAEGGEAATVVLGSKGFVKIFPFAAAARSGRSAKPIRSSRPLHITMPELYQRQINEFVAAARRKKQTRIPGLIGLESVRIMEAAYRSSSRDVVVKLG